MAFGTNPIAFGAPAKNDDYYMLDMATSTVALGKVSTRLYCCVYSNIENDTQ